MRFLRDLHTHLLENPAIATALGFDPYQRPPSLERFSAFLPTEGTKSRDLADEE